MAGGTEDLWVRRIRTWFRNRLGGRRSVFDLPGPLLCTADFNGYFTRVGEGWRLALGYSESELLARPFADFIHPDDVEPTLAEYESLIAGNAVVRFENRYRSKRGDYHWLRWSAIADPPRRTIHALAVDVSEQKAFEAEVGRRSMRDDLTGLPNRAVFLDRVDHALAQLERHSSQIGVILLDLDDFGVVNDTLGRSGGDEVLSAVAHRLEGAVRANDTVARVGADEFAVLCMDSGTETALEIAVRLGAAVAEPLVVRGRALVQTASSGVAVANSTAAAEILVADAEVALRRAATSGAHNLALFDRELRAESVRRLELREALREADTRGELELAYQPIVSLADRRPLAFEALIRWRHPRFGVLGPGEFVPLAEQSGLVGRLGAWVLATACAEAAHWNGRGATPAVTVNVSAHQLADPDLVFTVAQALEAAGLEPGRLWLEVTESAVLANLEESLETLTVLRRLGVEIALDDFGEGYSSLSQLRLLTPVSIMKIGAPFVEVLDGDDPRSRAIVAAIITLAHEIRVPAVAEGVETATQLAALTGLHCDGAQGFHLARPMARESVRQWLERAARARVDS